MRNVGHGHGTHRDVDVGVGVDVDVAWEVAVLVPAWGRGSVDDATQHYHAHVHAHMHHPDEQMVYDARPHPTLLGHANHAAHAHGHVHPPTTGRVDVRVDHVVEEDENVIVASACRMGQGEQRDDEDDKEEPGEGHAELPLDGGVQEVDAHDEQQTTPVRHAAAVHAHPYPVAG